MDNCQLGMPVLHPMKKFLNAWDSCDMFVKGAVFLQQSLSIKYEVEQGIFRNAQVYLRRRFLYSELVICAMYDSREISKHDRGPCEQLQLH